MAPNFGPRCLLNCHHSLDLQKSDDDDDMISDKDLIKANFLTDRQSQREGEGCIECERSQVPILQHISSHPPDNLNPRGHLHICFNSISKKVSQFADFSCNIDLHLSSRNVQSRAVTQGVILPCLVTNSLEMIIKTQFQHKEGLSVYQITVD